MLRRLEAPRKASVSYKARSPRSASKLFAAARAAIELFQKVVHFGEHVLHAWLPMQIQSGLATEGMRLLFSDFACGSRWFRRAVAVATTFRCSITCQPGCFQGMSKLRQVLHHLHDPPTTSPHTVPWLLPEDPAAFRATFQDCIKLT